MKNKSCWVVLLIFLILNFCPLISTPADTTETHKKQTIETPYIGDYLYTYPPYPIPARGKVNTLVYWDSRYTFSSENITVYDAKGTKVSGKERISIDQQSSWSSIVSWNSAGFSPGVYIIIIKHGSASKTVKVLIG